METPNSEPDYGGGNDPQSATGRLNDLNSYLNWSTTLAGACSIFPFWLIFFPWPHLFLVLVNAALPLAALLLVRASNGEIQIDSDKNKPRPAVAYMLFLPAGALAFDTVFNYYLSYSKAVTPMLTAAVVLAVLFGLIVEGRLRVPGSRAHLLLAAAALGAAYTISLNCALDRSAPEVFPAKVVAKSVTHGKHGNTYYLDLDRSYDWMPGSDISVPSAVFHAVAEKGDVCLYRRHGLFGVPWFVVGLCGGAH